MKASNLLNSKVMLNLTSIFPFAISTIMGKKNSGVDNNIPYQTLTDQNCAGPRFALSDRVSKPSGLHQDPVPNNRDMEVFRLRRKVAELSDENDNLHNKVTVAIATVRDEIRKHELWLHAGKEETRNELQSRVAHLKGIAGRLEEFMNQHSPAMEKLFKQREVK